MIISFFILHCFSYPDPDLDHDLDHGHDPDPDHDLDLDPDHDHDLDHDPDLDHDHGHDPDHDPDLDSPKSNPVFKIVASIILFFPVGHVSIQ